MRPGLTLRKSTEFIAIHCSASAPNAVTDVKVIDRWHRARGFLMVGYHWVIKVDGTAEVGRPVDAIGAHVEGFNRTAIGICLVGGVDKAGVPTDNFSEAQYATLRDLLETLRMKYPSAVIQGHRDFPHVRKACPSFDVRSWLTSQGLS